MTPTGNPDGWSVKQTNTMHWLRHSTLKSARAWRLKMALRTVYAKAVKHNDAIQAKFELKAWLSWATRCRLEPFKKLASTLKQRQDGVGQPQQCLSGGHEWFATAGKTSRARLQNCDQLYRHRVFENVQAQAFAQQPAGAGLAQMQRANPPLPLMSSSTQNGIEPQPGRFDSRVGFLRVWLRLVRPTQRGQLRLLHFENHRPLTSIKRLSPTRAYRLDMRRRI